MAIFKITWLQTGTEEIVNQSDRDTVEGYIACRFGDAFNPKTAKVELVEEKKAKVEIEEKEEVKPVAKPKTK